MVIKGLPQAEHFHTTLTKSLIDRILLWTWGCFLNVTKKGGNLTFSFSFLCENSLGMWKSQHGREQEFWNFSVVQNQLEGFKIHTFLGCILSVSCSVVLERRLRMCISSNLLGNAEAVSPGTLVYEPHWSGGQSTTLGVGRQLLCLLLPQTS